MPAWGPTHDDQRIWAMVAFLQKLPDLTPEQYQILTATRRNQWFVKSLIKARETMKTIFPAIAVLFLSMTASAHNGEDPAAEVVKKRSYVLQYQKEYPAATSQEERIRKHQEASVYATKYNFITEKFAG